MGWLMLRADGDIKMTRQIIPTRNETRRNSRFVSCLGKLFQDNRLKARIRKLCAN